MENPGVSVVVRALVSGFITVSETGRLLRELVPAEDERPESFDPLRLANIAGDVSDETYAGVLEAVKALDEQPAR